RKLKVWRKHKAVVRTTTQSQNNLISGYDENTKFHAYELRSAI
ncbi:12611_t:CDS:1, partial [Dentiscutata heterogama]